MIRIVPNWRGPRPSPASGANDGYIPFDNDLDTLDGPKNGKLLSAMRQAMLLNGVDFWGLAGMTSSEHTDDVIDDTIDAVEKSVETLLEEDLLAR